MGKKMVLCFALLLAALTVSAAALQRQQQILSAKLIRLHVVANSDSPEDQRQKLQVRDAVLQVTEGLSKSELQEALPEIEYAAKACLAELGAAQPVSVTMGTERFPTRLYDSFALPAGVYRTLRVTIGEGAGHNWWCVAFPSICFRATAEELEDAAVSAGFTQEEVRLITEEGSPYVLKFKLLELLERWKTSLF